MKKIALILLSLSILIGCSEEVSKADNIKIIGKVNNAVVIKKENIPGNRYSKEQFYITIEKNNKKLKLQLEIEETYNVMYKGLIIDSLNYNSYFYAKDIKIDLNNK